MMRRRLRRIATAALPLCSTLGCGGGVDVAGARDEALLRPVRAALSAEHFTSRGGRVFCAVEPLGRRAAGEGQFEVFVWAYCTELLRAGAPGAELATGSGSSTPCAVTVALRGGAWVVLGVKRPRDGGEYLRSVRAMFPAPVRDRIVNRDVDLGALEKAARAEASAAGL